MPPANWIIPEPAKRMVTPKPALATPFKISTDVARMTPTTLTNVSAGQTFIPAHLRYKASAPPVAGNTPAVSVRALINPAPAAKLPELLPAPGAARQNIHLARPVAPTLVRRARNPSPVPAVRTKSKSQQPNADLPVTNAKQSQAHPRHQALAAHLQAVLVEVTICFGVAIVTVTTVIAKAMEEQTAPAILHGKNAHLPEADLNFADVSALATEAPEEQDMTDQTIIAVTNIPPKKQTQKRQPPLRRLPFLMINFLQQRHNLDNIFVSHGIKNILRQPPGLHNMFRPQNRQML